MLGISTYTAPTQEPLGVSDAKRHCRVADSDTNHDATLAALITAARQYVENHTGRQLCTATYDLTLDEFPTGVECLYLPRPPLSSVTHLKYYDSNGTLQTWAASNYAVSTATTPGRINLAYSTNWPTPRVIADAITIRYVAGYGASALVPEAIKAAMKLLIGTWFENREGVVTGTIHGPLEHAVEALLEQYRVPDEFLWYGRRLAS